MKDDILVSDEEFDELPTPDLQAKLNDPSKPTRGRALNALARRAKHDESLISLVVSEIQSPENMNFRFLGGISNSHIAVACLWATGNPKAEEAVRGLVSRWDEPDRSDLLWFLNSQDLEIEEFKAFSDVLPTVAA